ncbi:kinase-like protein [Ascoidea rubescens DSM 1968]|uniref:Kinase-like protein n=1 Tax=Ascoidea rubescens DSM 1968 TaxID=1344418 RepID=A0A1D2VCG7_9ASCO|nr:kinase-like protein [Ascoidea rubescens DSM 1968]ODV59173.1 kinase-like protein [Ascoidea rubescens DSM 1968]
MAVKQVEIPRNLAKNETIKLSIDALHSEVEAMKDLDHLNVVQYLGFEQVGNRYSLFLEYVAGGSVGSCIRMHGKFDEQMIRFLTKQVLDGLSYLHSLGILHRDLKADNLLLDLDGVCKISDFGISKRSADIYSNDTDMSMQGTIFWMAPEVVDNVVHNKKMGYSAKIDIWSLGCVVLEMFVGRRPWSNSEAVSALYNLGKMRQAPPIPDTTRKDMSSLGLDFLNKCFQSDPEKRPIAKILLKHSFCDVASEFDFNKTQLAQMIKNNNRSKGDSFKKNHYR